MKAFLLSAVLFVVYLSTTACSPSQQTFQAPHNQEEASKNFIVKGDAADVEAVKAASTHFRVLSQKHGLYEVSGLDYETIKNIAPAVNATQNEYFNSLIGPKKEEDALKVLKAQGAPLPPGLQQVPPVLRGCMMQDPRKPTPQLELLTEGLFANGSPTMDLGGSIALSAAGSLPFNRESGELELRWDIVTPASSLFNETFQVGEEVELTPDSLGLYEIYMVAKEGSACAATVVRFLVTDNPEVELARETDPRPELDLEPFMHLERVKASESWTKATGMGKVIAVLDTGLNYNHPAIKFNLAINSDELEADRVGDDDENGFDDDLVGWDFVNGDNKPFDDEGHGSHVAGLAASHIIGLAKDAKILPIKVLNGAGGGDTGSIIAGIYYAVDNGADVINASLQRLNTQIPELREAIRYAHDNNVVFVSSAGNDNLDLSLPENSIFPGELDIPNVINVAAVGATSGLASYSNYGVMETDVAAPGGDRGRPIYSLAPFNPRGQEFVGSGGTSMAAPIVAGIVAQVLEVNPNLTPVEIKVLLMESGEEKPALQDFVGSGKLLNALDAVERAESFSLQLVNNM